MLCSPSFSCTQSQNDRQTDRQTDRQALRLQFNAAIQRSGWYSSEEYHIHITFIIYNTHTVYMHIYTLFFGVLNIKYVFITILYICYGTSCPKLLKISAAMETILESPGRLSTSIWWNCINCIMIIYIEDNKRYDTIR